MQQILIDVWDKGSLSFMSRGEDATGPKDPKDLKAWRPNLSSMWKSFKLRWFHCLETHQQFINPYPFHINQVPNIIQTQQIIFSLLSVATPFFVSRDHKKMKNVNENTKILFKFGKAKKVYITITLSIHFAPL